MKPPPCRVLLPDPQIRLYLHTADPVQSHGVKFPDRAVVGRRIAGGRDDPALRQAVAAKSLVLQELEHRRHQRLGNAVDLIQKQDALPAAALLHLLIDSGDNLAHGIGGNRIAFPVIFPLLQYRKADGALTRVVRHRIGQKTHRALPGHLFHNRRFSDSRRSNQQKGPLPFHGNPQAPPVCPGRVGPHRLFDFFLRFLNIHVRLFSSSTRRWIQPGMSITSKCPCSITNQT